MPTRPKIRVAVLGSGLGAMSAVWKLTSGVRRERFDVTVYTPGWRLGGKGASGRNARYGQRIEEHGLHAFLGFYFDAFGMMRDVYEEWKKSPENPFQSAADAFIPQKQVTLMEEVDGAWSPWTVPMPDRAGVPWDRDAPRGVAEMLLDLLAWLGDQETELARHTHVSTVSSLRSRLASGLTTARTLWSSVLGGSRPKDASTHGQMLGHLTELQRAVRDHGHLRSDSNELRRILLLLDLGVATAIGLVTDVLPPLGRGFASINHLDLKERLERHGASREATWSAPIRALYDMGFAYAGGDTSSRDHAKSAAGVALWVMLQMALGYRGAPLWKMRAGMGDTIFAPLYEVLSKQRGVKFELFSRVTNLALTKDENLIGRIDLLRQARPKHQTYDPLVTVKNIPSWPSEPLWDQLENGESLRGAKFESAWYDGGEPFSLELGRDFDLVILGISVGAFPFITKELVAASPAWKDMVEATKAIQTQAMQLWLSPKLEDLGWSDGTTIMAGYAEPFDSWGDMSHLSETEDWPKDHDPKTIGYFCSPMSGPDLTPLDDPAYPTTEPARVKAGALGWLESRIGVLWPKATLPGTPGLDFSKLVDLEDRSGKARFDGQLWRANIDPTERYVLSLPGSIDKRLAPEASGFQNLVLAGDWTASSLNAGSAEAAVNSGLRAGDACAALARVKE